MKIKSEAEFTLWESIGMIVGHSIGTGIVAVPFLVAKNRFVDLFWMVGLAYLVNVILHLMIAELSYNNGGVQLVKSFEGELFLGKYKKVLSWGMFVIYGLAIVIGVSGNINGAAQILASYFNISFVLAQIIYYVIAGGVVLMGMKAVGIAQKYTVSVLIVVVVILTGVAFSSGVQHPMELPRSFNNMLALFSMTVFATSANQAVIQSVKGLKGNVKKIRSSIFIGFAISSLLVLLVSTSILLAVQSPIEKEVAYLQLGEKLGGFGLLFAVLFTFFALLTTFWSNTLSLRDVVAEQTGWGNSISWAAATIPSLLFAVFGVNSFILLTRIMSGVVVLVAVMLVITYNRSRAKAKQSPICGVVGTKPFQVVMIGSTILCAAGSLIPLQ